MSRETQALIEAFEHLPPEEKRAFTNEVLRRSPPMKRSAPPRPPSGNRSTREMAIPRRGEVWLIDFGQVGKTSSRTERPGRRRAADPFVRSLAEQGPVYRR